MGDPAQVAIGNGRDGGRVFFYSWCSGRELARDLAVALDRGRKYWYMPERLARVVICQMLNSDLDWDKEGVEISAAPQEVENEIHEVDCRRGVVVTWDEGFTEPQQEEPIDDFINRHLWREVQSRKTGTASAAAQPQAAPSERGAQPPPPPTPREV